MLYFDDIYFFAKGPPLVSVSNKKSRSSTSVYKSILCWSLPYFSIVSILDKTLTVGIPICSILFKAKRTAEIYFPVNKKHLILTHKGIYE